MTAEFANRRLREVGGVSRNRLLVDKMIVWRAILGLIVASKWPAPEPQSACRFSTPRARDQRKQTPAMCAPTPRIPRLDFINSAMSMAAACDSAADLPKGYSGAPSSPLRRKKGSVLYASNYSLAAFPCSRNPTAAIAMAPMTAPVKASMVPPRLPALRVA
jgi:hypothetical protein